MKKVLPLQTLLIINTIMEKKQYFAPEAEAWVVLMEQCILSYQAGSGSAKVEDANVVDVESW